MSTVTIPNLPAAGALTGTEVLPIVQSNVTSKTTTQAIANLVPPSSPFPFSGSAQITGSLRITGSLGVTGSLSFQLGTQPNNIAIGSGSLNSSTTGNHNVAIGTVTLNANTSGTRNIAIGNNNLPANTTGGDRKSVV